jgi:hypothetical protein
MLNPNKTSEIHEISARSIRKNAWCKLQRVPAELSLASPQYPPEKPEKLRRQSENLLDLLIRGPQKIKHTGWCPPVISWFINPINYSYICHKP